MVKVLRGITVDPAQRYGSYLGTDAQSHINRQTYDDTGTAREAMAETRERIARD